MKQLTVEQLEHVGTSIITIKGTNRCLGDLLFFDSLPDSKGVIQHNLCFCPTNGRVPVSKEAAEIHNKALDQARLTGMDENCQIGQGTSAYLTKGVVHFFSGTVIAEQSVCKEGRKYLTVTFCRKGKTYRGRMELDAQCFNFKRIA